MTWVVATGQAERLRTVTPHRLVLAIVSPLAGAKVESLADVLRAFNDQNGVHVAYKAFYHRLARLRVAVFMRGMCVRLVEQSRVQTLAPERPRAVARFKDIVIHDGSLFALKPSLRDVFPGRFTTIKPAAVEIHATYSGCADDVQTIHIAPDCDAERPRTPFSADLVARLDRFRWQIELCFKEWKSYANLHQFDTANPHVAEGLMWANLCAAIFQRFPAHAAPRVGRGISTRCVAMCARHMLEALVTALLVGIGLLGAKRGVENIRAAASTEKNPSRICSTCSKGWT